MDTLINLEEEFAHEYVLLRKSVTCSICLEIYQKPACLPCQHGFCESCITTALKVRDRCPICSAPAKKNKLKHINNLDETLELFRRLLSTIEQSLKIKRQQRITQQSAAFKAAANKSAPTAVSTATNNNNNDNASGKVQKLFTEEMPDLELTQHSSDSEGEEEALNMAVLSTQDSVEPEPPSVADPLPTQATKALPKRASKAKAVEVPQLTLKDEISAPSGSTKGVKRSKKRALDELLDETQAEQPLTATATATATATSTATAAVTTPAAPTRRDAAAAAANHSAAKNFVPFAAANATLSSTPVQPSTDPVAPFLRTTVFEKGALVNVLPRTWAGMNKIGGVGKVEHVRAMDAQEQPVDLAPLVAHGKHDDIACLRLYYKVKYVLDGHTDDDIPSAFVEKFEELSRERRRGSSNHSNNSTPGRLSSPPPSSTKAARGKAVAAVAAVTAAAAAATTTTVSTDKENEGPVTASSVANAAATKKASKDATGSGSKRKALQEKPKNSAAPTTVAAEGETKPPPPKRIVTPAIEKVLNFDDDDEEEEGDAPHGDAGRAATTKPTAATAAPSVTTARDDDDDDDNESLLAVLDLKHSATLPSSSSSTSLSSAVTVSKPPASTKKLLTMKKLTKGGAASAVAASAAAAADDTADKLSGHKRGRNLVLLTTCIDETKQSLAMLPSSVTSFEQALAHFTATHREVSAVTHFTSSVTHVVVSVDKQGIMKQRTMKYMQALAHGVWVVSTKWIYACLQAGAIVDESEYEVKSNIKALIPRAPMRARQMRLSKKSPGLFAGYVVVFFGLFPLPGPTRSDLEDIVRVQGAQRCFTQMADFWAYFQTMRRRSREASSSSSSSSTVAKSGLDDEYPTVVIVRSTAAASSGGSSSTTAAAAAAEEEAALLAMTSSNVGTSVDPDHDVYFAEEHGDNGGGGGGGGGGGNDRQTLFDLERDRLRRYLATFPQVSALWIMDSVTNYEIQPFVAYAYKASSGSL